MVWTKFLHLLVVMLVVVPWAGGAAVAQESPNVEARPKRILLLGQKPDTHPKSTHEYVAAMRIIAKLLQDRGNLQVVVHQADDPWINGPELLDGADAAVLFLTEGAKWVSDDADRLTAFQRLARRKGGLVCLHWGSGSREAGPVTNFVALFGGCHGGPDRKYKVGDFELVPATKPHVILSGIGPFRTHDELYYDLKFPQDRAGHTGLLNTKIGDTDYPVAWCWERSDGGRSFGFTGLHFHENWKLTEYRRLVVQGILWSADEPIPAEGMTVRLDPMAFGPPNDGKQN